MGGLAHHLETAGIATTQVSLVRLHSEIMRPPRALWVSFELGRPFGPPDDAAFQRRVVRAALELLEAEAGPLLVDYPEDAPPSSGEEGGWACPISFSAPREALDDNAELAERLADEVRHMQPWHDRAVAARGRTTVGVSGMTPDTIPAFFGALLEPALPASPVDGIALADAVRLAAEDLKAFYIEAASAQPGDASGAQLRHWFWHDTVAGDVLRLLSERLGACEDEALRITAQVLMVPRAEA